MSVCRVCGTGSYTEMWFPVVVAGTVPSIVLLKFVWGGVCTTTWYCNGGSSSTVMVFR